MNNKSCRNIDYLEILDIRQHFYLILITIIILIFFYTNSSADDLDSVRILAVVNDDTILTSDFEKEIHKIQATLSDEKRPTFDYRRLVDKLINNRLIIQEAYAMGLDSEEWIIDLVEREKNKAAIQLYINDKFKPDLTIGDQKILEYFRKNYSRLQVRTISIANLEKANKIYESIMNGAGMDSISNEISLDMYRFRGGLHNMKFWSDVEAVLRLQAMNMEPGQLSKPFKYREIYAIMRVEKKLPADTEMLDQYKERIRAFLIQLRRKSEWHKFIDSLAKIYPINIDSSSYYEILADSGSIRAKDLLVESETPILESYDGQVVTAADIRRKLSHATMTISHKTVRDVLEDVLREAIEDIVLTSAIITDNYIRNPRIIRFGERYLDSVLIEEYLRETVVSQIKFNRVEFEEYYNANVEKYRKPDEYLMGQIGVDDEKTAEDIVNRLNDGAKFDFVARQYNENYDDLESTKEWATLESFPNKYREEIAVLKIGQSTRAYPTTEGFIIFNVKAVRKGDILPLDAVEMKIREVMFQKKFNEILDQTLSILKNGSEIEINDEILAEYFSEN